MLLEFTDGVRPALKFFVIPGYIADLVEIEGLATPARTPRTLVSGGADNLDSPDLCTWADTADLPLI